MGITEPTCGGRKWQVALHQDSFVEVSGEHVHCVGHQTWLSRQPKPRLFYVGELQGSTLGSLGQLLQIQSCRERRICSYVT